MQETSITTWMTHDKARPTPTLRFEASSLKIGWTDSLVQTFLSVASMIKLKRRSLSFHASLPLAARAPQFRFDSQIVCPSVFLRKWFRIKGREATQTGLSNFARLSQYCPPASRRSAFQSLHVTSRNILDSLSLLISLWFLSSYLFFNDELRSLFSLPLLRSVFDIIALFLLHLTWHDWIDILAVFLRLRDFSTFTLLLLNEGLRR